MDALDDVNGLSERAKRYFFFSSLHVESVDTVDDVDSVSAHICSKWF